MNKNVFGILIAGASAFYGMPLASAQSQNPWVMGRAMNRSSRFTESRGMGRGCVQDRGFSYTFTCAYIGWHMDRPGHFETQVLGGKQVDIEISVNGDAQAESFRTLINDLVTSHYPRLCPAAPGIEHAQPQALASIAATLVPEHRFNEQAIDSLLGSVIHERRLRNRINGVHVINLVAAPIDERAGWTPARCLAPAGNASVGDVRLNGAAGWSPCREGIRRATLAALNATAARTSDHFALGKTISENSDLGRNWSIVLQSSSAQLDSSMGLNFGFVDVPGYIGVGNSIQSGTTRSYIRSDVAQQLITGTRPNRAQGGSVIGVSPSGDFRTTAPTGPGIAAQPIAFEPGQAAPQVAPASGTPSVPGARGRRQRGGGVTAPTTQQQQTVVTPAPAPIGLPAPITGAPVVVAPPAPTPAAPVVVTEPVVTAPTPAPAPTRRPAPVSEDPFATGTGVQKR